MKLRIADNLVLPIETVTEKLAFLGRTGSGKTYAAMKLAELMLEAGAQIVSLDPVGAWHGLRIGGPWNVYIFGGLRGDFPLEPTGGKLLADLIADRGISAVIDVSQFIRSEQVRFACDFVERFFNRKKALPSAVHLFLEECQEFVPQNVGDREAHMLHHFERAWKLGRNFGIGGSLISQRPQEVNKKALNQAGTLFVFNMTGPQERKAIADWTRQAGIDEDIESVLPMLKTGEPHVWSPTFLEVSKTVKILSKLTADVSMTPKVGARTKEQPLTPIDVEKLTAEMAATIEKSKADDPKELRKEIAALKKRISEFEIRKPEPVKVESVEVSVLTDDDREQLSSIAYVLKEYSDEFTKTALLIEEIRKLCEKVAKSQSAATPPPVVRQAQRVIEYRNPPKKPTSRTASSNGDLSGPEHRILDAIAWLESIGVEDPEQPAVAFLAGYTYGGGGYNNPRGALRTKGLVDYIPGDRIRLTDDGRHAANHPETPLTTEALHSAVLDQLPGPERRILEVILRAYPESLTNEECASDAGYTAGAGGYNNPRGRLRTLGLIDYPEGGKVRARDILFIE